MNTLIVIAAFIIGMIVGAVGIVIIAAVLVDEKFNT